MAKKKIENNEIINENVTEQKENQEEKVEEELIKAKANVCLKHNSKYIDIGKEFEVTKKDFNELKKRNLVEKSK